MPRFKFNDYVDEFEEGKVWGRGDLAALFCVSLGTARYHLERAVGAGLLNKQYGSLGIQSGWLYALPATMPRLMD